MKDMNTMQIEVLWIIHVLIVPQVHTLSHCILKVAQIHSQCLVKILGINSHGVVYNYCPECTLAKSTKSL